MPVDDPHKIDAISTDPLDGSVNLTIFDAWDWSDERSHLIALQEKLNSYFGFFQSGQLLEVYPAARGKSVSIRILTKYPLPESGCDLVQSAAMLASQLNVRVHHVEIGEREAHPSAESPENSAKRSE